MDETFEAPAQPLTGVGGWLAFWVFAAFLAVVYLPRSLRHAHVPLIVCNVTATIGGVTSAILILRRHVRAIYFVGATLGLRLLALGFAAYQDSRLHQLTHPALVVLGLMFGVAANTLWFVYFRTSRRVHNTLGRNL